MKKPILSEYQRRSLINPEFEVAKLKFKREFEKSSMGKFMMKIVEYLAKIINSFH